MDEQEEMITNTTKSINTHLYDKITFYSLFVLKLTDLIILLTLLITSLVDFNCSLVEYEMVSVLTRTEHEYYNVRG